MPQSRSASRTPTTPTDQTPVLPQVWAIAWPVVAASMLDAMEGLIDISMVGQLGPEAISAVGLSRQILFLTMVMAMAISTGSRTLVAQFYGAERHEDLSHTAQQAILMGALLAVVMALLGGLIARPVLILLGAQPEVLGHAVPFLRIYFAGVIFMMLNFLISAIFGGAGDTRTPLKISCLIIILKLPLTYGLIFGAWGLPQMGVCGAAVGTLASRAVGCVVGFWLLTSGRSRVQMRWTWRLSFNRDIIGRMMRIGVPSGDSGIFSQWCSHPVLSGGELDLAAHDCGRRADDWATDADDRHYASTGFWRSSDRAGWAAIGRKADTASRTFWGKYDSALYGVCRCLRHYHLCFRP